MGPGARVNLTRRFIVWVPLPAPPPLASKVCHVPPPVTCCEFPGLERYVPDPVSVIFERSRLARAEATPPAETVPVPKLTLMMSHRMWWLLAEALKFGESPADLDASIVEAGFPLSHPRARLISVTPASPALKVRAFIVCSSFCVCLRSEEHTSELQSRL